MSLICDELNKSIGEERKAATDYAVRESHAYDVNDRVTARLYHHIAHEELRHYKEFTELKSDICSNSESGKITTETAGNILGLIGIISLGLLTGVIIYASTKRK